MKEKTEYECYRVTYNEGEEVCLYEVGKIQIGNKKVTKIEYSEIPISAAINFSDETFSIVFNLNEISFRPIEKKGEEK